MDGFCVICSAFPRVHTVLHRCGKHRILALDNNAPRHREPGFLEGRHRRDLWTTAEPNRLVYTCETGARSASFYDETDLSAECAETEA